MSITELEALSSRLRTLVRDAVEFGQNRNMVLDLIEEVAGELQDEADRIVEQMEAEFLHSQQFN